MDATNQVSNVREALAEAQTHLSKLISLAESVGADLSAALQTSVAAETNHDKPTPIENCGHDAKPAIADSQFWRTLVQTLRDVAAGRPEISSRRGKDAWQGTALLQASLLNEIERVCADHLRSTTPGPRSLGTQLAIGPKTDALAKRDGSHIVLKWTNNSNDYVSRIYEPTMMDVTPALADLLARSIEEPLRVDPGNSA
jgi:hypothetical protein